MKFLLFSLFFMSSVGVYSDEGESAIPVQQPSAQLPPSAAGERQQVEEQQVEEQPGVSESQARARYDKVMSQEADHPTSWTEEHRKAVCTVLQYDRELSSCFPGAATKGPKCAQMVFYKESFTPPSIPKENPIVAVYVEEHRACSGICTNEEQDQEHDRGKKKLAEDHKALQSRMGECGTDRICQRGAIMEFNEIHRLWEGPCITHQKLCYEEKGRQSLQRYQCQDYSCGFHEWNKEIGATPYQCRALADNQD